MWMRQWRCTKKCTCGMRRSRSLRPRSVFILMFGVIKKADFVVLLHETTCHRVNVGDRTLLCNLQMHPELENLQRSYYQWLMNTGQEEAAGEVGGVMFWCRVFATIWKIHVHYLRNKFHYWKFMRAWTVMLYASRPYFAKDNMHPPFLVWKLRKNCGSYV